MQYNSESLLCFQHCKKVNVFCYTIPNNCPVCKNELSNTDLTIPPFRIPNPLTSEANKLSLLIKPTFGNFIRDFKRGDLLHIALSNSERKIFEFNENGISSYNFSPYSNWTNFLSVSLASLPYKFVDLDEVLENTITMNIWEGERYNEVNNNCFDYVISVLNASDKNSNQKLTKLQLTQEFISPTINKTIRLLSIVRNVLEDGFFLQGNITESIVNKLM